MKTLFKIFIINSLCFNIFGQSVTILPSTTQSPNVLIDPIDDFPTLKLKTNSTYSQYIDFYKDTELVNRIQSNQNGFTFLSTSSIDFQIGSPASRIMSLKSNGNVIIGNSTTSTNKLDVSGTIRSSELDFTENTTTERRPVFVDKDGVLRVENVSNHYASYNFSSVQAQNSADDYTKGSGYAWFNTTNAQKTFYLPVNLPDGVKISNVRMFIYDNSTSNLSFTFNKNSHLGNNFTTIATATSSTQNTNLFSINDNATEIIDNQNNSYYVNISSSGNWTGNTLQFHSLVITYQYQ